MQDENPSETGSQSTQRKTQADKEWSDFQRDLDTLGRQLAGPPSYEHVPSPLPDARRASPSRMVRDGKTGYDSRIREQRPMPMRRSS